MHRTEQNRTALVSQEPLLHARKRRMMDREEEEETGEQKHIHSSQDFNGSMLSV